MISLRRQKNINDTFYYAKLFLAMLALEENFYSKSVYVRDIKAINSREFLGLNLSFSKRVLGFTIGSVSVNQSTIVIITDSDKMIKSLAVSLDGAQFFGLKRSFEFLLKQGRMLSLSVE